MLTYTLDGAKDCPRDVVCLADDSGWTPALVCEVSVGLVHRRLNLFAFVDLLRLNSGPVRRVTCGPLVAGTEIPWGVMEAAGAELCGPGPVSAWEQRAMGSDRYVRADTPLGASEAPEEEKL